MHASARYALLALALAFAVTAARPIDDMPAPPRPTPLLRRLLQINSTQTRGPWAPIVGTTGTAMPGYYPRLNLTRNGSTQIAATSVPDPLRVSSFPGGSAYPVASTTASGSLANGGAAITGGGVDFNDPAIVGPPGKK